MNGYKRILNNFKLKNLGIDSFSEVILYIHKDSTFFKSEGIGKKTRVIIEYANKTIAANIHSVSSDILKTEEASLSQLGWETLGAKEGDPIDLFHADVNESIRYLRAKLFGNSLDRHAFDSILKDIIDGLYSDIHLASFITACAGDRLSEEEISEMTRSMVASGGQLQWKSPMVMDKHCIGGLPGNRTTIIVVPILASLGLLVPKTSSRAITSPAGTADTMEVFCPVNLDIAKMQSVVEKEGACIVWGGGSSTLSPADDILIRIERALNLDSVGLMISSVLSKKKAAGSTHVLIDMPMGPTAKIRSGADAKRVSDLFIHVGQKLGLQVRVHLSDGSQPIGRGIGPALEARDVLSVLSCEKSAPKDLRLKSIELAGMLLDMSGITTQGRLEAQKALDSGKAHQKFHEICEAQGGFQKPTFAQFQKDIISEHSGIVTAIDNRKIAMIAKLAGAPKSQSAGVDFLSPLGRHVSKGDTLFTIHAEAEGQFQYAVDYASANKGIITL